MSDTQDYRLMGEIIKKKSFYQHGAGAHMFDVTLKESYTRWRKVGERVEWRQGVECQQYGLITQQQVAPGEPPCIWTVQLSSKSCFLLLQAGRKVPWTCVLNPGWAPTECWAEPWRYFRRHSEGLMCWDQGWSNPSCWVQGCAKFNNNPSHHSEPEMGITKRRYFFSNR